VLTHLDNTGKATMVDVSQKPPTRRVAKARARVLMREETVSLIRDGQIPKGDVLAAMRLSGIMAAKKTSELIFLCHPVRLTQVVVEAKFISNTVMEIVAEAIAFDSTGVEMEALTAVSVAALTVFDMCKAVDRELVIEEVRLLFKSGGKSKEYRWEGDGDAW